MDRVATVFLGSFKRSFFGMLVVSLVPCVHLKLLFPFFVLLFVLDF